MDSVTEATGEKASRQSWRARPDNRMRLVREALVTSGSAVISTALSGISSIVLAKALGVELRGVTSALLSVGVLCGTFGTLGLPATASYALARAPAEHRPRIAQAMLIVGVALALVAGGVCLLIAAATQPASAGRLALVATAGVAVAIVVQNLMQQLVLTGASVGWYGGMQIAPAFCVLIAVILAAALGLLSVTATITISGGGAGVGAALGAVALVRHGSLGRTCNVDGWREVRRTVRPHVRFALMLFVITSLAQVVQRLDILLVEQLRGARDAGLYTVAAQLASFVLVVPAGLGALVFRRGARSETDHWGDAMNAVLLTALVTVTAAGVLALVAGSMIPWLVGRQYAGSVTPLRLLLPGFVLLGLQSVVSNYIASRDQASTVLAAWLITAVVGIALDIVLIPVGGIVAASLVSSFSYLIVLVMHVRALRALRPS